MTSNAPTFTTLKARLLLPGRLRDWLSRRIARQLWVAFFSVFLLTYLATALVVLSAVRSAVTESELGNLEQTARFTLDGLDGRISRLADNLNAWSRLDVMNDLASGDVDKRIDNTLELLKAQYSLAGDLHAFDAKGRLVASSRQDEPSATLPPAWRPSSKITFIDRHADPLGGGDIVTLSLPVKASFSPDLVLGTLVLTLPWSEVHKALTGKMLLLRGNDRPELLDSTVTGLDRAFLQAVLTTRQGWLEAGQSHYLVNYHSHLKEGLLSGWQVVALGSPDALYRHLSTVALQLAGLCLLLAVPLTLAIRWMSIRLTAPLRELTGVVTGITETGDLARRVAIQENDELGALATAFNHMAESLELAGAERERFVLDLKCLAESLEEKVHLRTRELTATNGELSLALDSLKSAQSQLIHQEKMASLGQLVAGVAHEINNPIGFIYANFPHLEEYVRSLLQLLDEIQDLPLPADARSALLALYAEADLAFLREDMLKIIRSGKSGAARVKEIISSLRSFSRLDEAVEKVARLEDGLDDTLAILQHHYKNRIEVVREYHLNIPVLCRPGQLNQVFMNILYNAIQAIDGPGTITVGTACEQGWAVVRIADTGRGIPPELLGRIFDPFFTTKSVGEGTGLGLSISFGIVEKHGGRIEVTSQPGVGTRFTIYLPLATAMTEALRHESTHEA